MRRNVKAVQRKNERIAIKEARDNNTRAPDGSRIRRQRFVYGELEHRKVICRNYNRRDRRKANMQAHNARFDPSIEVTGRPSANLISATARITS